MSTTSTKLHPMVTIAAVTVIVASLVGTAAMLGWLPSSPPREQAAPVSTQPAAPTATGTGMPATAATSPAPAAGAPAASGTPAQSAAPAHKPKSSTHAAAPASAPATAQAGAVTPMPPPPTAKEVCSVCGKVEGVRTVEQATKPSGVGVLAGAAIGGLLGNQVGGGSGKTLATVAGAVGGGYAGNEIEKRTRKNVSYEVDVRMDNGERKSFAFETQPTWRTGDAVRVVDGALAPR